MLLEVLPEQVKNAGIVNLLSYQFEQDVMFDDGVAVFDVGAKYEGMREHIFYYFPRHTL